MKVLTIALAAGVSLSGMAQADTQPAAAKPKADPLYLPYEAPGIFAKIPSGETIHIKCMGSGSPTVILTAGAGDWSAAWRKVQPQIAKTTRVCAWDRPGFGFSSGTTQPQTTSNITSDLEAALKAAHIRGPYIAVGHSLGGYESVMFKDRNPQAVVGMVLVDPSIPDQKNRVRQAAPALAQSMDANTGNNLAVYRRCIAGLKSGALKIGSKDPDGCLGYPPDYPPELTLALDQRDLNPLRFATAGSMFQNFDGDGPSMVDPRRNYGNMPLIVLTATKDPAAWPPGFTQAAKDELPALHAVWARGHDEYAALSSRGVNRRVPDTTHYIQYDQPQVVIDAVDEVVAAARHDAGERNN
jgi:pimeloyl-ACP methyl ester carboxylesterase